MTLRAPRHVSVRLCLLLSTLYTAGLLACAPSQDGEGEGEEGEGEEGEGEGQEGEGEGQEGEGEGEGEPVASRFVAVGYGGRRVVSLDGRTWTLDVADVEHGGDDDNLLRGACSGVVDGKTVILAVGGSAQGRVMRSIDGGASWTAIVDDKGWIGACAFLDGVFVMVGSGRSARSLDGGQSLVNELRGQPSGQMRDLRAFDGKFVAVGGSGVSTSADGLAWSAVAGPEDVERIAFGNGVYVAMAANVRARSTDLVEWTSESVAAGNDIVFAQGRFLIVGEGYRQVSTDGLEWTQENEPAIGNVAFGEIDGAPIYVGTQFVARRRYSSDGITWENSDTDNTNGFARVIFAP